MQYQFPLICALFALIASFQAYANTFGVPERPNILTPLNGSVSTDLTPSFTSSDFVIKDDAGEELGNSEFTASEYLLLEDTSVTLVSGSNLVGEELDNSGSVIYNISEIGLTLSGLSVESVLINHKRMELIDSSQSFIAYVQLPNFIWQAENKDAYQAIRFKKFDTTVVVEWHYADAAAANPWDVLLQAVLSDSSLGLKINNDDFTADFASDYGSEEISLCDESTCIGHSFSNIYNSGNAVVCNLPSISDDCSVAEIFSNSQLDDLSVTEVAYYKNITDTGYSPADSLDYDHTYQVLTRHAGTIGEGQSIFSGWSDATKFTTRTAESNLSVEVIAPDAIYLHQNFSMTYRVINTGADAVSKAGVYIITPKFSPSNGVSYTMPEGCILPEGSHIYCLGDRLEPGTYIDFVISDINTGQQIESTFSEMVDGLNPAEFNNSWTSSVPIEIPFTAELNVLSENEANSDISFSLELYNHSGAPANEVAIYLTVPSDQVESTTESCTVSELPETNSSWLSCDYDEIGSVGATVINFSGNIANDSIDIQTKTVLVEVLVNAFSTALIEKQFIVAGKVETPEPTDPEPTDSKELDSDSSTEGGSGGGGSLWVLSFLVVILSRKKML
jgi:hypothetical protein